MEGSVVLVNTVSPCGSGKDLNTVIQNTKHTKQVTKKKKPTKQQQKPRPEAKDGVKKEIPVASANSCVLACCQALI